MLYSVAKLSSLAQWKVNHINKCQSVPAFYISIEGWRMSKEINTALYSIEIGVKNGADDVLLFKVEKRYSELQKLHKAVSKVRSVQEQFPPKKLFGSNDFGFIRERQKQLQKYFESYSDVNKLDLIPEFNQCFMFTQIKNEWQHETRKSIRSR